VIDSSEMENGNPDRSLAEIKTLLRKLDPKSGGNHKDRVRRLARFRNYVSGETQRGTVLTTPEFYDDDIPLLMLGSTLTSNPTSALYDDDADTSLYGLLQACGSPSREHASMLKRSARHAIALLKYLVIDFVDVVDGRVVQPGLDENGEPELNSFAHALCMCTKEQLSMMNLMLHMEDLSDGKRSGSKEDACEVLVLLLTRHMSANGDKNEPLPLEDLLPTKKSRNSYHMWLTSSASADVQKRLKNLQMIAASSKGTSADQEGSDVGIEISLPSATNKDPEVDAAVAHAEEQLDGMGIKLFPKTMDSSFSDAPTRWDQSQLSMKAITFSVDARVREAEREKEEADRLRARQEDEKKRTIGRDPLGLRGEDFDLRVVQKNRDLLIEQALEEIAALGAADEKVSSESTLAKVISKEAKKKSLFVALKKEEEDESKSTESNANENVTIDGSIVTTDPNFDPILFLTLVHGGSTFDALHDGLERLNNKTDNQVLRLQGLVRDNFGLFLQCADGIDLYDDQVNGPSSQELNSKLVKDQLSKLDQLSNSCVHQAKKNFTSLLDNTNEVRKTQSALAVLHRIGPILQAPTLMRQHLEAGKFTAAVKAYRRVLLIDDDCNVELLKSVKAKAAEAARDAQRDLEKALGDPSVPVSTLLDAIRDLGELNELEVPPAPKNSKATVSSDPESAYTGIDIDIVRNNPPALACLILQSNHFTKMVDTAIEKAETTTKSLCSDSGLEASTAGNKTSDTDSQTIENDSVSKASGNSDQQSSQRQQTQPPGKNSKDRKRWRYDVLDSRVVATVHSVNVARTWLPRLVRIGVAAREAEGKEAKRFDKRRVPYKSDRLEMKTLSAFEVYADNISPTVARLVEHATFCALGCGNGGDTDEDLPMSFGQNLLDSIQALLRAPLPPALSAKCTAELADLVDIVYKGAASAGTLRPNENDTESSSRTSSRKELSFENPLETFVAMAENAVVTAERRTCIYAFDACSRTCSVRASNSGVFDGESLLLCVQKLSEELTRPQECSNEIERGCQLVVRRCCEGLANYVRERGVSARLRAVAECANALSGSMLDVIRDVAYLTSGQCEAVEELLSDDIESLEGTLFDEFLEGVSRSVTSCVKLGWVDLEDNEGEADMAEKAEVKSQQAVFPSYLSASLLAIVRCRAQVEKALGDSIRRAQGVTYQFLALGTAADGVVNGICNEVNKKMHKIGPKQVDRLAAELHFMINTLKIHLSEEALSTADLCREELCAKAGHRIGEGPDGLGTVENLERLGRVYVLCLAEL